MIFFYCSCDGCLELYILWLFSFRWNLMGKQHPRQNAHKRGAFQMLATPNVCIKYFTLYHKVLVSLLMIWILLRCVICWINFDRILLVSV